MEDLKNWKKYENNGDVYYYTPDYFNKIRFYDINKSPSKEYLDNLAEKINTIGIRELYPINDSLFSVVSSYQDNTNLYELPFGCYTHCFGTGSKPERLENSILRNDSYFTNQKLLDMVQTDISTFINSGHIFKDLNIIQKRGYLLYGLPGTGKTSFVRHLVSEVLPKECHIIWLKGIPSDSFIRRINHIPTLKIFIVEEIASFKENNDVREMLEFLDGESSSQNSIVIATTNYPAELEQNLADRPSRFDVVLEVKEPTVKESVRFFESFLKRKLEEDEVTLTGLSVSHIKEICLLSLMYKLPLQQCYDTVKDRRTNFKKGFSNRDAVGIVRDPQTPRSSRG